MPSLSRDYLSPPSGDRILSAATPGDTTIHGHRSAPQNSRSHDGERAGFGNRELRNRLLQFTVAGQAHVDGSKLTEAVTRIPHGRTVCDAAGESSAFGYLATLPTQFRSVGVINRSNGLTGQKQYCTNGRLLVGSRHSRSFLVGCYISITSSCELSNLCHAGLREVFALPRATTGCSWISSTSHATHGARQDIGIT